MKFRLLLPALLIAGMMSSSASAAFTGYTENFESLVHQILTLWEIRLAGGCQCI